MLNRLIAIFLCFSVSMTSFISSSCEKEKSEQLSEAIYQQIKDDPNDDCLQSEVHLGFTQMDFFVSLYIHNLFLNYSD